MNKYLVRYYDRHPLDPAARWFINRTYIDAETGEQARLFMQQIDVEVIDVILVSAMSEQESIRDDMVAEVEPILYILRAAVSGTFEVDAEIANDNNWMDTGVVRVPQTPDTSGTVRYDITPRPSDMPDIDFDNVKEIPF